MISSLLLLLFGLVFTSIGSASKNDTKPLPQQQRVLISNLQDLQRPAQIPPGVLREASPITSIALAELELTPDSSLYGQAGDQETAIRFKLTYVASTAGSFPRQFAISVQEHGTLDGVTFPDSSSFQPRLSEQRLTLYPNQSQVITVFLRIPRSALPGTKKTYTVEVQPFGTTASGAANMLVRRFYFTVVDSAQDVVRQDLTAPQCETIERVVSQQCLSVSLSQECRQHAWRGQLRIQV